MSSSSEYEIGTDSLTQNYMNNNLLIDLIIQEGKLGLK